MDNLGISGFAIGEDVTIKTKRAAFFAALSEVDGLRYHVKKCFDSKGNGFEDAGPSLRQVTELSDFTLVDLVLFLKDLTPAEVAAINGENDTNSLGV